ncbi:MAG TPA: hypothetical protein VLA02_07555 [Reyranella sp.]|nr:hypothetical protein [Reyranella sp.]
MEIDSSSVAEVRAHRRSFSAFERLVLFAALHVALTLACLALAFIGHLPVIALLFWIGGTLAMVVGFAVVGGPADI